jgi:hypothetical protein
MTHDDGTLILCPYCLNPVRIRISRQVEAGFKLPPDQRPPVMCNWCDLDITKDALIETDEVRYQPAWAPCAHCGKNIVGGAQFCYRCKQWQKPR